MSNQTPFNDSPRPTIQLEIIAEGGRDSDPALAGEVARSLAAELRKGGYVVQPADTGQKGGMVYDLIPPTILAIQLVWSHKEALISYLKIIAPILEQIFKKQDHHYHLEVKVTVDSASVSVDAPSYQATERLAELSQKQAEQLMILRHQFETQHPQIAEKVTPQSSCKLTVSVPPPPSDQRK